jgi:transposase-like protein
MQKISYDGYRFPPEIIQQAIWLYLRFALSLRDVEDLLAERGITVSYETIRCWVSHFAPIIAADLRKRRVKPHTTWHLDEVYLKIAGRMVYLWRSRQLQTYLPASALRRRQSAPRAGRGKCRTLDNSWPRRRRLPRRRLREALLA